MARVALIFLFVFCALQLTTGYRVQRDTENKDGDKTIDDTLQQIGKFFENTFSKDNLEKFGEGLKDFGEKLGTQGKELFDQASEGFKKLQEKEPSKQT